MSGQAASGQDPTALPIHSVRPIGTTDPALRLTDQLNTLSEVVETLTYRLLELEERLAASDGRLEDIVAKADTASGASEEMELRLVDTEERLLRIEAMLCGPGAVSSHAWGQESQAAPSIGAGMVEGEADAAEHDLDGPFPEECEQPFLDELEADAA